MYLNYSHVFILFFGSVLTNKEAGFKHLLQNIEIQERERVEEKESKRKLETRGEQENYYYPK